MQKKSTYATFFTTLLLASASATAIEAGGIRFDDKISLGGTELQVNGAGVRTKFVFDVYAMALYLPGRAATPEAVAAQRSPRRIALQLLRDVSTQDFMDALKSGMQANLSETELVAIKPQIEQFSATLATAKDFTKGTVVLIDYVPATGTRLTMGGQPRGKDIPGEAFYDALLKIWLGNKPVQPDLKNKLLGK